MDKKDEGSQSMKGKNKQFVMVRSYLVSWKHRGYSPVYDAYMQEYKSMVLVARSCVSAKQLAASIAPMGSWCFKAKLFSEVECKVEIRL